MGVVTRKSTMVTNRDATPMVPTSSTIARGGLKQFTGYVSAVSGDSSGSYYPMGTIPSNARVSSIDLLNAALGSADKIDVGVYWPTVAPVLVPGVNFGTVVGAGGVGSSGFNFFASGYAGVSAANSALPTNLINQSGQNPINVQEQELWQALGLPQDPNTVFDIAVTPAKNGSGINGAGYIGLRVGYTDG